MIVGALAFMSIQKSDAQLKVIQSERQQKPDQLNDCGNNATCTNIGSLSFIISSQATNDTKLNYIARQANSIKDYAQKDTTPFILPFPWETFFYDLPSAIPLLVENRFLGNFLEWPLFGGFELGPAYMPQSFDKHAPTIPSGHNLWLASRRN